MGPDDLYLTHDSIWLGADKVATLVPDMSPALRAHLKEHLDHFQTPKEENTNVSA